MKRAELKRISLTFPEVLQAHGALILSARQSIKGYLTAKASGRTDTLEVWLRWAKDDGRVIRRLRVSMDRILGRSPSEIMRVKPVQEPWS